MLAATTRLQSATFGGLAAWLASLAFEAFLEVPTPTTPTLNDDYAVSDYDYYDSITELTHDRLGVTERDIGCALVGLVSGYVLEVLALCRLTLLHFLASWRRRVSAPTPSSSFRVRF